MQHSDLTPYILFMPGEPFIEVIYGQFKSITLKENAYCKASGSTIWFIWGKHPDTRESSFCWIRTEEREVPNELKTIAMLAGY